MQQPAVPGHGIDPAALMAAVLAVVLAMLVGEGAWILLSSFLGGTLLLVLLAYLPGARPSAGPRDKWLKVLASAAVVGLAASLTLVYPIQERIVRPAIAHTCPQQSDTALAGCLAKMGCNTSVHEGIADPISSRTDDCAGSITTATWLPWAWGITSLLAVVALLVIWKPKRDVDKSDPPDHRRRHRTSPAAVNLALAFLLFRNVVNSRGGK